jgi:hypothetical protein
VKVITISGNAMSTRSLTVALAALTLCSSWANLASAGGPNNNTTGLPTYPHDSGGMMDSVYRSVPNGQHCMHYAGSTPDALAVVEDWYKKQLPKAHIDDVNKNSLYGGYFKLDGIKMVIGNDFLTIYRTAKGTQTSIEIFKCNDGPPA